MYHYIRPDSGKADPIGEDLSVSPEHFAAQMDYLAKHHFTPLTLAELADVRAKRLALPVNPIVLTFDDGYRDFYTQAWPVLHQHGFKATAFIVTGFVGQPHSVSWSMIEELHRSGLIEFGAHTVTHKELPSLATAKAQQEIVGSKRTLEAHLGQPVRTFAYPSGRFSQREVALLRQAGFEIAVTTRGGFARANQDSLLLPRLRIHATTRLAQFAANLE
jgi:peptidoglycan/xylan/chitin deacetylase (PgdA/CDA1 family)